MRSRYSGPPGVNRMPYYPYPQPMQNQGYPPQQHFNPQSYQAQPGMPFQQSWYPPPSQGMGMESAPTSKGVMGYFQNNDGQFDLDKVFNTAGQVANTYQQFTPIVKGISSFIKGVKT
ncbi:YppG-like protein [Amphibacillus marinus]|uniref:YppG-like protein n=1 Tax=Amphibacillus marinus TaxID=872970 RepID=A0A1H8JQ07_9BACI|nr:YppG family protein [Amphibacillus marinus]SEN82651.1 YppG-like protein [Amphibacillus marinus]